jgi:peptidyl-prolyl cis-trans isomerase B (cyclophilin B)
MQKIKIGMMVISILLLSGCTLSQEILDNVGQSNKTSAPSDEGYLAQMGEISQMAKQNIQKAYDEQNQKLSEALNEDQNKNTQSNNQINQKKNMPDNSELVKKYASAKIKTNLGDIKVKFYNSDSPITVGSFLKLSQDGFYAGTKFHRVIKDFMIQGGDPLSKDESTKSMWGTGGPEYKFADEFNSHKLVKGSLAMANSGPDTNGSQFFIVTAESTPWLDGKHTNFGEVTEGMDVVKKIEKKEVDKKDCPIENVTIESIELLEK